MQEVIKEENESNLSSHEHSHEHSHDHAADDHGHDEVTDLKANAEKQLEEQEIKLLNSANLDAVNAKKIDSYIMRHKCDFSWMFQDILKQV